MRIYGADIFYIGPIDRVRNLTFDNKALKIVSAARLDIGFPTTYIISVYLCSSSHSVHKLGINNKLVFLLDLLFSL